MSKSLSVRNINPDDVEYVKGDGPYSIVVFSDRTSFSSGYSIKKVTAWLGLIRVHKSYAINPKYAHDIKGSYIYMDFGKLPISRRQYSEVDSIVFDVKEKPKEYYLFIFEGNLLGEESMVFATATTKQEAIDKIIVRYIYVETESSTQALLDTSTLEYNKKWLRESLESSVGYNDSEWQQLVEFKQISLDSANACGASFLINSGFGLIHPIPEKN